MLINKKESFYFYFNSLSVFSCYISACAQKENVNSLPNQSPKVTVSSSSNTGLFVTTGTSACTINFAVETKTSPPTVLNACPTGHPTACWAAAGNGGMPCLTIIAKSFPTVPPLAQPCMLQTACGKVDSETIALPTASDMSTMTTNWQNYLIHVDTSNVTRLKYKGLTDYVNTRVLNQAWNSSSGSWNDLTYFQTCCMSKACADLTKNTALCCAPGTNGKPAALKDDPSAPLVIFGNDSGIGDHINRLNYLAAAASTDPTNKEAFSRALELGLNYLFDTVLGPLIPSYVSINTYNRDLSQPPSVATIAVLANRFLSQCSLKKIQNYMSLQKPYGWGVGSNLVQVAQGIVSIGLALNDPAVIARAYQMIICGSAVVTSKSTTNFSLDGIQSDWAFHEHGVIYNGGYGAQFLGTIPPLIAITQGTDFFNNSISSIATTFRDYLLKGSSRMMRGLWIDIGSMGRYISRPKQDQAAQNYLGSAQAMLTMDPTEATAYTNLVTMLSAADSASAVSASQDTLWVGNQHFWTSDFMVHSRKSFYTSSKMFSSRVAGTESINNENVLGGWLPFGLNFHLARGDEYDGIYPFWDWTKLPGVTNPNEPSIIGVQNSYFLQSGPLLQKQSFVGGVSDGEYGASIFTYNQNNFKVQKALFFFDDHWVALGTGITSTGKTDSVTTTLNQALLNELVVVDGITVNASSETFKSPTWVLHDGWGYVFNQKASQVFVSQQTQTGSWGDINPGASLAPVSGKVFKLWIDHGKNPSNASYEYSIFPEATQSSLETIVKSMPSKTIQNDENIQAVWNSSAEITEAIFLKPNVTLGVHNKVKIKVDQACAIILNEKTKTITVSNPLGTEITVKVTLTGLGTTPPTAIFTFNLPGGDTAGSSSPPTPYIN